MALASKGIGGKSDFLLLTVCGRTLSMLFNNHKLQTVQAVQQFLQRELKMPNQNFELRDSSSNTIVTNGDLITVFFAGKVPLEVAMSEESIHYIENRREELAQMQWKLVRDKVDGLSSKVIQITNQLSEFEQSLSALHSAREEDSKRVKKDIEKHFDDSKGYALGLNAQLQENLSAVSQLVHAERNMHEGLKESIFRQIQSVREAIESERHSRGDAIVSTNGVIDNLRQLLEDEFATRQAMESKFAQDMHDFQERIDRLVQSQAETKLEMQSYIKQLTAEANLELGDLSRKFLQLRSGVDCAQLQVATRLQSIEDKTSFLERRVLENANRHATQLQLIQNKTQGLSSSLESVRLQTRQDQKDSETLRPAGATEDFHKVDCIASESGNPYAVSVAGSISVPLGNTPRVSLTLPSKPAIVFSPATSRQPSIAPAANQPKSQGLQAMLCTPTSARQGQSPLKPRASSPTQTVNVATSPVGSFVTQPRHTGPFSPPVAVLRR